MSSWPPPGGTWVLDLDGVVWLAGQGIPGAPEAIEALRRAGRRVLFVTNNSSPKVAELIQRLGKIGVVAAADEIVSSAQAAAGLLEAGASVLPLAGPGALEALEARRVRVVDEAPAEAVVVGFTRDFDFDRLAAAAGAVRRGARLIGTNEDATYPTPTGLLPGAGSLLAAVATAGGQQPVVAGKPHRPMVELVRHRAADVVAVVGDRPSTDGALAERLGVPFALVLSGVTPSSPTQGPVPATVAPDLGQLVASLKL